MAASSQEEDGMISGINITPMVDITLVLLIIFMVTAKIIVSQSMPLDLPKAASSQQIQTIFSIQLRSNGETNVDSKKVPADESVLALAREAKAKNDDLRAVIQADQTVTHGRVIHVLDLLKQAGVAKIAFGVTPIESDKAPAPAGSN